MLKAFLVSMKPLAKTILPMLSNANAVKVVKVKSWKHYCGLEPRYYEIHYTMLRRYGVIIGTILIQGGLAWKMAIIKKFDRVLVLSDGCWGYDDAINFINAIIKADIDFFIKS
jgi:hypothetical protein